MITYKWRITEHKYAYICNSDGNTPFIRLAKCDDTCYITKGNTYCRSNSNVAKFSSDDKISRQVYSMSEAVYARLFDEMKELIATDDDGKTMKILDYHYYWNIDNDNCSLVQYGYKGNEGLPGKDGRGIANITSAYTNGDLIMHIQYTDGQEDNFPLPVGHDGAPGKDGEKGNDGNNSSTIIEINNAKSELEDIRINELSAITQTLNRLLDKSKDELEKTKEDLSGITDSVGTVSSVTLNLSGYTYELNKFIGASAMTKTEFSREISAVDGRIEEIGSRVDVINNTVTDYNKRVDLVEGKLSTTLSKFDETKNQLNAFQQEYDVVNNKLSQVVSELTNNGDISFSEIYQTAHQLGLLVSNHDKDNPIMAEIIAQINSSGSSILISADKIVISGETIAKKLNAVDVTINGGYSRFNRDGSGYLANENIFWNSNGDLTIKKDVKIEGVLTVGDVANGLKDEDVTLCGNDPRYNCVFKKNGSGYLGGGAIAWTSSGDTFITGNLIIGGAAKEDMVNYINGTNLNLGQGTSNFNKDGSGSLAGGMITWNNKQEMKIKAKVTITGTDDTSGSGITDNIIAALNTKDLVINNGASKFSADGSGYLANKAINWKTDGTLSIDANINAKGGKIGGWTINENTLISMGDDENNIILDGGKNRITIKSLKINEGGFIGDGFIRNPDNGAIINISSNEGVVKVYGNTNDSKDCGALISSNGIFSNCPGICIEVKSENTSDGLGYYNYNSYAGISACLSGSFDVEDDGKKFTAGIYGRGYMSTNSFGGYFDKLKVAGLILRTLIISNTEYRGIFYQAPLIYFLTYDCTFVLGESFTGSFNGRDYDDEYRETVYMPGIKYCPLGLFIRIANIGTVPMNIYATTESAFGNNAFDPDSITEYLFYDDNSAANKITCNNGNVLEFVCVKHIVTTKIQKVWHVSRIYV